MHLVFFSLHEPQNRRAIIFRSSKIFSKFEVTEFEFGKRISKLKLERIQGGGHFFLKAFGLEKFKRSLKPNSLSECRNLNCQIKYDQFFFFKSCIMKKLWFEPDTIGCYDKSDLLSVRIINLIKYDRLISQLFRTFTYNNITCYNNNNM